MSLSEIGNLASPGEKAHFRLWSILQNITCVLLTWVSITHIIMTRVKYHKNYPH